VNELAEAQTRLKEEAAAADKMREQVERWRQVRQSALAAWGLHGGCMGDGGGGGVRVAMRSAMGAACWLGGAATSSPNLLRNAHYRRPTSSPTS